MLSQLSAPRRRFVLAAFGLAIVGVAVALITVLLHRRTEAAPVAQDRLGPVVLVPGYGGSKSALEVLAAALRQSGRDATVVTLAGDGTGDLATQARVVDTAVHEALKQTDTKTVDVVGYSAGGVTVRLWLDEFNTASLVRRVVTLGSPHHGTTLAALALDLAGDSCPIGCQQLATDSDLLRGLNAHDETPSGPTWVSIWTENDRTVVPPDSASLQGALDFSVQSICPREVISHGNLPRNPTVIALTTAALAVGPPTPPTGDLCRTP